MAATSSTVFGFFAHLSSKQMLLACSYDPQAFFLVRQLFFVCGNLSSIYILPLPQIIDFFLLPSFAFHAPAATMARIWATGALLLGLSHVVQSIHYFHGLSSLHDLKMVGIIDEKGKSYFNRRFDDC